MSKRDQVNAMAGMVEVMEDPIYPAIKAEYYRLLTLIGRVEGDVVALALLARRNVCSTTV